MMRAEGHVVRRVLAALAIVMLVVGANGCGSGGSVRACPQRGWSKGWISRSNATMVARQSFNWESTGIDGACTGFGTRWVGVNWAGEHTYCVWANWFPYFSDCEGLGSASSAAQNDYKSSDVWGVFDWNVTGGSSGRVNIHTYVQGFKSGNAHTHCWMVATSGSGNPWGEELQCDGGNG